MEDAKTLKASPGWEKYKQLPAPQPSTVQGIDELYKAITIADLLDKGIATVLRDPKPLDCNYDEAKQLMHLCYQSVCLRRGVKPMDFKTHPSRQEADTFKQMLRLLTAYFTNNKAECEAIGIDLRKSLWIAGDPGVGKTLLMETAHLFTFQLKTRLQYEQPHFAFNTVNEVFDKIVGPDIHQNIAEWGHARKHLYIDDLVSENTRQKHYALTPSDVMGAVMMGRYDVWWRFGFHTHITSNKEIPRETDADFKGTTLVKLYGEPLVSRLNDQYNFVIYDGSSKRRRF